MQHAQSSIFILAIGLSSCALEAGEPWGRATFDVTGEFSIPDDRVQGDAFKTSRDYLVVVEELEVQATSVELEIESSGQVATFDPAAPPAGYSLCHNGHCHADDGSLVEYADVETAAAGGDLLVAQSLTSSVTFDSAGSASFDLGDCSDNCLLPRGIASRATVRVTSVRLRAQVRDDLGRLPDPVVLDVIVPIDLPVSEAVRYEVGADESSNLKIEANLVIAASLLDGIDFSDATAAPAEIIQQNTIEALQLETSIKD